MRIRELRIEKNLTQTDLAKAVNVGQPAVAAWESGKSRPRAEHLPVLAEVLGCSIDEFFKEEV